VDEAERDLAPPFVVGVARSGTTLLRMMLDAHPQLAIPHETHFLPEVVPTWDGYPPDPLAAAVNLLRQRDGFAHLGLDPDLLLATCREHAVDNPGDLVRTMYRLYAQRHGKPRWGDKTPPYLESMPEVVELLPEARFIHVIRDGRDVAVSLRNAWFGPTTIADAARCWRDAITAGRAAAASLGSYREIRYEHLVRDPSRELGRICEYLDLRFSPRMLEYHRSAAERLSEIAQPLVYERDRVTASVEMRRAVHVATTHPPDPRRIGAWRSELTPAELEEFSEIAGPLLAELGYPDA
jgi:hypothetical protein